MVVGWSDFAIAMGSHFAPGGREPDGVAAGPRATQRNKQSIFNGLRLPICAARLIGRHFVLHGGASIRALFVPSAVQQIQRASRISVFPYADDAAAAISGDLI